MVNIKQNYLRYIFIQLFTLNCDVSSKKAYKNINLLDNIQYEYKILRGAVAERKLC